MTGEALIEFRGAIAAGLRPRVVVVSIPESTSHQPPGRPPEESNMLQAEFKFVRLLPSMELPRYTHTPGSGTPHPYRDPRGHSHDRKGLHAKPLIESRWSENRSYLLGLDLFNLGFYWEAHDEFDRLQKLTSADTLEGRFLKGLVKMAAAGMKVREESIHGVRRHAASAGEVFADIAAESDIDRYCGLDFTLLQFAADRAAQLSYPGELEPGRPLRVFPFLLIPEPSTLC
jgi:hypothetical protein